MHTAARMQLDPQPEPPKQRDYSAWVVAIITVLVYIVTVAGLFASVKTTSEEHTQQIRELQQNGVTRHEVEDLKSWMIRIDGKLDRLQESRGQHGN